MSIPIPDRTLFQAVDILTRPHETNVDRQGAYLFTRQDPALIPALRAAIHSNIGAGSGGGNAHHTRNVLSIQASELYGSVGKRIRKWVLDAGYIRTGPWPEPEALLRTWLAMRSGRLDERAYLHTLNGWIAAVENLLIDPPRHWSLNAPCPVCGERWAHTGDPGNPHDPDADRVDALHVTEREPAQHSEIICRACGATWDGIDGARQLRLAMETESIPAQHQKAS